MSKHQNEAIPRDSPNGVAVNGEPSPSTPEVSEVQTVPFDQLENGEGTTDQQKN